MGTVWDDRARREQARRIALAMRLSREDADDVAQTTLAKLRDAGESEASIGLVSTAARRVALDLLRARVRRARREQHVTDDEATESYADDGPTLDELAARGELRRKLASLLPAMPSSPRRVIEALYVEGRSIAELTEALVRDEPVRPDESPEARHKRYSDWAHQNHARGLLWLRDKVER